MQRFQNITTRKRKLENLMHFFFFLVMSIYYIIKLFNKPLKKIPRGTLQITIAEPPLNIVINSQNLDITSQNHGRTNKTHNHTPK